MFLLGGGRRQQPQQQGAPTVAYPVASPVVAYPVGSPMAGGQPYAQQYPVQPQYGSPVQQGYPAQQYQQGYQPQQQQHQQYQPQYQPQPVYAQPAAQVNVVIYPQPAVGQGIPVRPEGAPMRPDPQPVPVGRPVEANKQSWWFLLGGASVTPAFNTGGKMKRAVPEEPDMCAFPMTEVKEAIRSLMCPCVVFGIGGLYLLLFAFNFMGGVLLLLCMELPISMLYAFALIFTYIFSVVLTKRLGFSMTILWIALTPFVLIVVTLWFLWIRIGQIFRACFGVMKVWGDCSMYPVHGCRDIGLSFTYTKAAVGHILFTSMTHFRNAQDSEFVEFWVVRFLLTLLFAPLVALLAGLMGMVLCLLSLPLNVFRSAAKMSSKTTAMTRRDAGLVFFLPCVWVIGVFLAALWALVSLFAITLALTFCNILAGLSVVDTYTAFENHHYSNCGNYFPRFDLMCRHVGDLLHDTWTIAAGMWVSPDAGGERRPREIRTPLLTCFA